MQRIRKLLPKSEELLLAPNDLLLIGKGLKEYLYCQYITADFLED